MVLMITAGMSKCNLEFYLIEYRSNRTFKSHQRITKKKKGKNFTHVNVKSYPDQRRKWQVPGLRLTNPRLS